MNTSLPKEVKTEIPGFIRVYKDGSVDRLFGSPIVPPTLEDPKTGVSSKDVTISTDPNISARIYLPNRVNNPKTNQNNNNKIPILVYFHGGGFCVESAYSEPHQRYMNILSGQAGILIVSVEYRLAPEHLLPAAYEDCWAAINWVGSGLDLWVAEYGDLDGLFIGGDSSGANIAHNLAMRAGNESLNHGLKILGMFVSCSHFLDDPSSSSMDIQMGYKVWELVYPDAPGGSNSYMINPMCVGAPSLLGLGCSRVLVLVAEKEEQRDCEVRYYEALKQSGFSGRVEFYEAKGESHCFHIFDPDSENAKLLFQRLASFLCK